MKFGAKITYLYGVALLLGALFLFSSLLPPDYLSARLDSYLSGIRANLNRSAPHVKIGSTRIIVEIAEDDAAVRRGLSGRPSLDSSSGMIFIFAKPDRYRFWMPDMHFSIDIIWINNGKVVGISENVPPETDISKPKFYLPPKPAQYVLEVNAGFAKSKNIKIGDSVILNNIK